MNNENMSNPIDALWLEIERLEQDIDTNIEIANQTYAQTSSIIKDVEAADARADKNKKLITVLLVLVIIAMIPLGCFVLGGDAINYHKAENYMADGKYKEAMEVYQKLGDYEDSETLYKDAAVKYAEVLADEGNYLEAYEVCVSAGVTKKKWRVYLLRYADSDSYDYKVALEDSNRFKKAGLDNIVYDAEYKYVKNHKSLEDEDTKMYLKDLYKADYKESRKIANNLADWNMKIIISTEKGASKSKESISTGSHVVINCKLDGKLDYASTKIKFVIQTPDGTYSNTSDKKWKDGDSDAIGWIGNNRYNGSRGTVKAIAYDQYGNKIGSKSVKIK